MSDSDAPPFFEAGEDSVIQPGCIVGLRYRESCGPSRFGNQAVIRSGSIIYADVAAGDDFETGHYVTIRENSRIGDHVLVGTQTVIEGHVTIGDFVRIQSNCFICAQSEIGSRVFVGPGAILTNDRYPLKMRAQYRPEGPVLEDGVSLGAGVIVGPGVRVGRGSFVAAGAVVTADIPEMSLVKGVPGRAGALPAHLREMNTRLAWQDLTDT